MLYYLILSYLIFSDIFMTTGYHDGQMQLLSLLKYINTLLHISAPGSWLPPSLPCHDSTLHPVVVHHSLKLETSPKIVPCFILKNLLCFICHTLISPEMQIFTRSIRSFSAFESSSSLCLETDFILS